MSKVKSPLLQPVKRSYIVVNEYGDKGRLITTEGPTTLTQVIETAIGGYDLQNAKRVTVYELKGGVDFDITTEIKRVEPEV